MKKVVAIVALTVWLFTGDWLLGLCTLVLGMGWAFLTAEDRRLTTLPDLNVS